MFSTSVNVMINYVLCFSSQTLRSFAFSLFDSPTHPAVHRALRYCSHIMPLISIPTTLIQILILLLFWQQFPNTTASVYFQTITIIMLNKIFHIIFFFLLKNLQCSLILKDTQCSSISILVTLNFSSFYKEAMLLHSCIFIPMVLTVQNFPSLFLWIVPTQL